MAILDYKELTVWQKAMDLVTAVYKVVTKIPREELYSLTDQIRRAAVSIPSNIAEGKCRNSDKEFNYFLGIARGSCAELETQLLVAEKVGYLSNDDISECLDCIFEIRKMIVVLQGKLK